ncbi:MAG: elongation factor 4, partial [Candidatus Omnitrophica bacterium]|nr:elongation factor 4 [Candidatus Omnitrophota bacterium]
KPVVFCSLYPVSSEDYPALADALAKYVLNDAAFVYQKESSAALGQGFRCGFLGLLHLEVVQERLQREYNQSIILTVPSVRYRFLLQDGSSVLVDNPSHYPDPAKIKQVEEPYVRLTVFTPERYLGAVIKLCLERRAVELKHNFLRPGQREIFCQLPLAEVIFDFHDRLKSITQGYGSFDYELSDSRLAEVVKLDVLVNGERVDALSIIVHRQNAYRRAVKICEKLKQEIPRHQFPVVIQAAIGSRVIARSHIPAFRKDVTAKCYGGDVTRKRKLLEKQKEGKKKMKMVGSVMIPQKAFVAAMKIEE